MSEQLEPGMKVECIYHWTDRQREAYPELTFPTLGAVYMVREVRPDYDGIRLVEIVNPAILARSIDNRAIFDEPVFTADCFRPIRRREQNIEQFREIDARIFGKPKVTA